MAVYGKALRDRARDNASAAKRCDCGHPAIEHRELQGEYEIQDGVIVRRDHPDYRPLHFHCGADGCSCIRVLSA